MIISVENVIYLSPVVGKANFKFYILDEEDPFARNGQMACVIQKTLSYRNFLSHDFVAYLKSTVSFRFFDCRRECVLKGSGPPFSRCQVTPPVALVVIVSTRNHAMINAYLRERTGDRRSSPNRSFLMNPPGGIYQRPRKCTAAAIPSVTATR